MASHLEFLEELRVTALGKFKFVDPTKIGNKQNTEKTRNAKASQRQY